MEQRRKIEEEREARRCLAAAEAAGGTIKEWARANGVDSRSLNAWRMNLARRGSGKETEKKRREPAARRRASPRPSRGADERETAAERGAMLVELVPTPRAAPAARYTVVLGEARVEVGNDFDPQILKRLLEVLRSC